MDNLVHIKISNKNYNTTANSELFSKLMQQLQDAGYFPIITPETINVTTIDPEDYKNIVLYRFTDGMEITVQDLVDTIKAKQQCIDSEDTESIATDLTNQEQYPDIVTVVEVYIDSINKLIQDVFPDNDELHTKVSLNDDYVEKAVSNGNISYQINTNNPKVLALLSDIKNKVPESEILSVFAEILDSEAKNKQSE